MSISDERITEIRNAYYDAKMKMRDTARIVAVEHFTKSTSQCAEIERTIGSLLMWANNDFDTIEDRTPNDMCAKPLLMGVLLEAILRDMVKRGITNMEWIKNRLPEMEVKVHNSITKQRGQDESN